jgi:glycosyltransferase involved in cell wall biosynthesis
MAVKNSTSGKGSSDGNIKIITVGRFVRQKDYNTALLAFRELVARRPDCNFIYNIVGYGPLESEIRSETVRLKIDQRVKMFINPSNIPEILNESDIFLSTSLFEGVSNSIMEAMVAGLPIVATDVGDNKYLIRDGSNGYLVPCRDVSKIVDKLEDLSRSEEKRKEFGRNNHKILETEFSKTRLLEDYMELFSSFGM